MDTTNKVTIYYKLIILFLVLLFIFLFFLLIRSNAYSHSKDQDLVSPVILISVVLPNTFQPIYIVKSKTTKPIAVELDETKKIIAEQIISLFENDTIVPQYDYIENIGDGRGFTAGIIGFTSAYGEIYKVVNDYSTIVPSSSITNYLNKIRKLEKGEIETSELEDFVIEWQKAARDAKFRNIQDKLRDENFYIPAMNTAKKLGVTHDLSKAFIYDTIIQHGNSPSDPDGLPNIIKKANRNIGGSPADGIDEVLWLSELIKVRREVLLSPANEATKEAWSYSTDRCDFY